MTFTLDNMHFYLQYVSRHLKSVCRDKLPILPIFMSTICLETYNLTPEKFSTYKSVSGDTISSYKMSPETQFPTKKCPHRPTNKHLKFHVGLLNPLEA